MRETMSLSVVIAAFDAEPFLAAALDSVLREVPRDVEVIVVDDGSRDGTAGVLAGYGERIRVLRNAQPSGPGPARNQGAQAASGAILAFHDADDLVLPGRFSALQEVLEAAPEIDLVFANGIRCDDEARPLGRIISRRHAGRLARRCGLREMLGGGVLYPQALSIRRARFWEMGGFMAERGEDWDFALRASLRLRMAFVDRPVFAYRRHPGGVTAHRRHYAEVLVEVLERFVAGHPGLEQHVSAAVLDRARASQFARCARLRLEDSDRPAALEAWARAIELAPLKLRYRWRRWLAASSSMRVSR